MVTWILTLMLALRLTEPGPEVPWSDTYEQTAQGIARAAHEHPLPVTDGEQFTAALLTVQAWQESRFKPDEVHDHGAGHGEWGVHAETARGITDCSAVDMETPAKGARCALELMHASFRICSKRPLAERLGWFAWGATGCDHRLELSRHRLGMVARLMRENPLPESLVRDP